MLPDRVEELKAVLPSIWSTLPDSKHKNDSERATSCPKCGGDDRFITWDTGRFWCRQCDWRGDNIDFYQALHDVDFKGLCDIYLNRQTKEKAKPIEQNLTAIYTYHDRSGTEIIRVKRFEEAGKEKTFRQEHWNGSAWVSGTKGIEKVLYRLTAVLQSSYVIVVEGEKDADLAAAHGLCATTGIGGAGSWRNEYAEPLRGKHVAVIGDNDEAGRKYVAAVTESLRGVAASIRNVSLPGLPEKGDLTDWFQAGGTAERLNALIDSTAPLQATAPLAGGYLADALFNVEAFQEIDVPPKSYHLFPIIWTGAYVMITGARGVGKTWFIRGMANAITCGVDFGPWKCHDPASVLIIDGELSMNDLQERTKLDRPPIDRKRALFVLSDAYVCEVLRQPSLNLANQETRTLIRDLILARGIKIAIFDNIASLTPGIDENSKLEWDEINQWFIGLRYAGVSCWLVHHLGKNGDQRGTSGREDNIDMSIKLLRPNNYEAADGARFVVSFPKKRIDHKHLHLVSDVEMQCRPDEDGRHSWVTAAPGQDTKMMVLSLLALDMKQKTVAEQVGVSPAQVSKLRRKLIEEGSLDSYGILTIEGKTALQKAGFEV